MRRSKACCPPQIGLSPRQNCVVPSIARQPLRRCSSPPAFPCLGTISERSSCRPCVGFKGAICLIWRNYSPLYILLGSYRKLTLTPWTITLILLTPWQTVCEAHHVGITAIHTPGIAKTLGIRSGWTIPKRIGTTAATSQPLSSRPALGLCTHQSANTRRWLIPLMGTT